MFSGALIVIEIRTLNTFEMSFVATIKPISYDLQSISFLLQKNQSLGDFLCICQQFYYAEFDSEPNQ